MSFDIQWSKICHDDAMAASLKSFLNTKLAGLELPHYLSNLQVVNFRFGQVAPDITIRDIDVPFSEFYEAVYGTDEDTDENLSKNNDLNQDGSQVQERNVTSHDNGDIELETKDDDEGDEKKKEEEEEDEEYDEDGEDQYFDKRSRPKSRRSSQYYQLTEPELNPKTRPDSPSYNMNTSNMFMNTPNTLLMPRGSSSITPTMGRMGVGVGLNGLGGSLFANGGGPQSTSVPLEYDRSFTNMLSSLSGASGMQNGLSSSTGAPSPQPKIEVDEKSFIEMHPEIDTSLDLQLSVDFDWDSQLYIEITCDLLVNYPAPEFIRLPVRLKMTDLKIHSLMTIAYIAKRVFISFLCDIESENSPENDLSVIEHRAGGDAIDSRQGSRRATATKLVTNKGKERIDILKDMKIEGEIGNLYEGNGNISDEGNGVAAVGMFAPQPVRAGSSFHGVPFEMGQSHSSAVEDGNDNNGLVLRNIGKIEKFLISAFRGLIIDELAWPGWIELDFNETEEEVDESDNEGDIDSGDAEGIDSGSCFSSGNDAAGAYSNGDYYEDVGIDVDASTDRLSLRTRHRPRSNRPSFVQGSLRDKSRRPRSSQSFGEFESSSVWSSEGYFTSDNESS